MRYHILPRKICGFNKSQTTFAILGDKVESMNVNGVPAHSIACIVDGIMENEAENFIQEKRQSSTICDLLEAVEVARQNSNTSS